MNRKFSVIFNNLDSYKDLGLFIKSRPNIPIAEKNVNIIDVEGMNGSLTEDIGTYKSIEIEIDFSIVNKDNFYEKLRYIKAWLQNVDDNRMIISDDTDFFYLVDYVKLDSSITRTYKVLGVFKATFICKPFCFAFDGLNVSTIKTNGNIIMNNGTVKSDPIIKITGTATINLFINSREIIINNLASDITLDCELKEAYNSEYSNLNNIINGDYPFLDVGKNVITWIGNITKIEVKSNWRCL